MPKIINGFLPWILYFIIAGTSLSSIEWALGVALIVLIIKNKDEFKKGFILTWGSVIFFALMLILVAIFHINWLVTHTWILSNAALALISWSSLAVKKPFTLQYAREQVKKELWNHPAFIKINVHLTVIWALVFTFCMLIHITQLYWQPFPSWFYQIITNGLSLLAILFTMRYPTFYKKRSLERLKQKTAKDKYLQGNYKPVHDLLDQDNLEVVGEIPTDLNGAYMRNGPNPAFDPISYTYPFDGDGMIHAVYIQNGKARYKNRYVQTDGLTVEQRAGHAVYGGVMHPIEPNTFKNGAFINIIQQQEQLIALYEGDCAYTLDKELTTTGKWQPGTDQPLKIGPHPRLDPQTGERWFLNYDIKPPYITLHKIDSNGKLTQTIPVDSDHPYMIHDFVLTQNYIIFFECPVYFDLKALENNGNILQWRPEIGTKIKVVSCETGNVKSFKTDPFFIFHFANGHERGNELIIDYVQHSAFHFLKQPKPVELSLVQTKVDLDTGSINHEILDKDGHIEFPRINDDYTGKPYRYIYCPKKIDCDHFNTLTKYDTQEHKMILHPFGHSIELGEAVFVAKPSAKTEDDGYLIAFAYNQLNDASELLILDAKGIDQDPLARIKMPRRIPNGLHGNWIT